MRWNLEVVLVCVALMVEEAEHFSKCFIGTCFYCKKFLYLFYVYVYAYVYVHICMFIYMFTHFMYKFMHMYMFMYICLCICLLILCMFFCIYFCAPGVSLVPEEAGRHQIRCQSSYKWLWTTTRMLGNQPMSPARATGHLNCWAISPTLSICNSFFFEKFLFNSIDQFN